MWHHLDLTARTQISVCKSPFPSTSTPVASFRVKTIQQRPLLLRKVKTRLADCVVTHHLIRLPVISLHQLLMSTGCKSSHSSFLDVNRSNGGLRISGMDLHGQRAGLRPSWLAYTASSQPHTARRVGEPILAWDRHQDRQRDGQGENVMPVSK